MSRYAERFPYLAATSTLDVAALKVAQPRLHRLLFVEGYIGNQGKIHHELPADFADQLNYWLGKQATKQMNERANADKFNREHAKKQDAEIQKAIDRRKAELRLEEYVSQGLECTDANISKIADWVDEIAGGTWTPGNVDAAVKVLRNQLTWSQPAPPAPKPQPTVWSPGQPLPDAATEAMLRAAHSRT
jgi:hypothetical protein